MAVSERWNPREPCSIPKICTRKSITTKFTTFFTTRRRTLKSTLHPTIFWEMQWTETATGDRWSSGQDHQIWGQDGHAGGRRRWRPRTVDTSGGCGAGQVTIDPLAGGRRGRARPVLIRPGLRAWQGHPGRPMPRARCRQARRAPSPASSGGGGGVPQFPGTVSQRHVKSRGESASGCSRGGRFPVRAGSGGL